MYSEMFLRPLRSLVDGMVRLSQTKANYWAEFIVDGLLVVALLGAGLKHPDMSLERALGIMAMGMILFSLIEYCIHRWLFHWLDSPLSQGHEAHHQNPMGFDALPFFLPAMVSIGILGLLSELMPDATAFVLTGSIVGGYLIYGASHHFIHHVRYQHPWIKRWAALHHIHHVHPDSNYGVTTPLWDVLLGTRYVQRRRRGP